VSFLDTTIECGDCVVDVRDPIRLLLDGCTGKVGAGHTLAAGDQRPHEAFGLLAEVRIGHHHVELAQIQLMFGCPVVQILVQIQMVCGTQCTPSFAPMSLLTIGHEDRAQVTTRMQEDTCGEVWAVARGSWGGSSTPG